MHLSNVGQDDILANSSSSVSPQEIKTPQERLSIDITEDTSIRYISWKKTLKKVLALAVPYSINGYIITLGIFVNTLIFANFGEDELAASAITSAAGLFTVAVAKASFGSTSELTSRNINTKEMLGVIQQQSWIQAIIESIPLIIITSFNKPIFIALGQQPKIVEIANRYLLYYNVAIPPILLLKSTEKFLISIKHAHTALFFNLFNTLSSCGFGYLLALGKLGFPKLGITGIAHASSISAWLSFSLTVIYLFSRKQFLEYRIFSSSLFGRMEITKQLFKIGIPLAMQTLLDSSQFFLQTTMIGWLGANSLSAEQIVLQFVGLITSPILSISAIAGILVGKDINKNQAVNVKKIVYISLMLSILLSIGGIALFTSTAEPLTAIFISRDSPNFEYILSLTKILFAINSINSIADGLRNVCAGGLSGFYDVVAPTLISFVGLWLIGTPLAATLAFPVNQGVNGLLGGKGIGLFSTGFALVRRWKVKSDNPRLAISDGQKSFLSRNKNLLVCESSCRKNREAEGSTPLIPVASSNRDNVSIENRYEKNCFSRISRSCIIL